MIICPINPDDLHNCIGLSKPIYDSPLTHALYTIKSRKMFKTGKNWMRLQLLVGSSSNKVYLSPML